MCLTAGAKPATLFFPPPKDFKMSEPLLGTASAAQAIERVHYGHDQMIDLLVSRPGIAQNEIARYFGYTVGWVSRVMNSDAFQARLAVRKEDLIDPLIRQSFEERLKGLANQSLDVIQAKLEATGNADLAIKALEISTKALGMGARVQNAGVQVNTFVVALPSKVEDEGEWAQGALSSIRRSTIVNGTSMSNKISSLMTVGELVPAEVQYGV